MAGKWVLVELAAGRGCEQSRLAIRVCVFKLEAINYSSHHHWQMAIDSSDGLHFRETQLVPDVVVSH